MESSVFNVSNWGKQPGSELTTLGSDLTPTLLKKLTGTKYGPFGFLEFLEFLFDGTPKQIMTTLLYITPSFCVLNAVATENINAFENFKALVDNSIKILTPSGGGRRGRKLQKGGGGITSLMTLLFFVLFCSGVMRAYADVNNFAQQQQMLQEKIMDATKAKDALNWWGSYKLSKADRDKHEYNLVRWEADLRNYNMAAKTALYNAEEGATKAETMLKDAETRNIDSQANFEEIKGRNQANSNDYSLESTRVEHGNIVYLNQMSLTRELIDNKNYQLYASIGVSVVVLIFMQVLSNRNTQIAIAQLQLQLANSELQFWRNGAADIANGHPVAAAAIANPVAAAVPMIGHGGSRKRKPHKTKKYRR